LLPENLRPHIAFSTGIDMKVRGVSEVAPAETAPTLDRGPTVLRFEMTLNHLPWNTSGEFIDGIQSITSAIVASAQLVTQRAGVELGEVSWGR
jgi:hypothetical protein